MRLFEKINMLSIEGFSEEIERPTHIVLTVEQLRQLKEDYRDLYGDEQPNFGIKDIEETLALTICVGAADRINGGIEFLKKVRTGNKQGW